MKIYAFEVRDDETDYFSAIAQRLNIEITCSSEILTMDNIDLVNGYTGITVLGQYQYDKKMLDALKTHGIFYLATRTVGYNHIDIEYAKKNRYSCLQCFLRTEQRCRIYHNDDASVPASL